MTAVADTTWHEMALNMRSEGLDAATVGAQLDKHPATIRKLFARNPIDPEIKARDERLGAAIRDEIEAAEIKDDIERREMEAARKNGYIPGQTTVDDQLMAGGLSSDPDEAENPTPHPQSILWTGENKTEVAMFLGRGEDGTIYARNIDLPTLDEDRIVRARPGDTIIRVGENAYRVEPLDFKREAGEPVGDMPPREPENTEPWIETRLKGTRQLALDFGPNAAPVAEASIVFKSEKQPSGFYGLGDIITGTFTARVTKAPGEEKFDKDSEEYRAKPTAYVATITDLELD